MANGCNNYEVVVHSSLSGEDSYTDQIYIWAVWGAVGRRAPFLCTPVVGILGKLTITEFRLIFINPTIAL